MTGVAMGVVDHLERLGGESILQLSCDFLLDAHRSSLPVSSSGLVM